MVRCLFYGTVFLLRDVSCDSVPEDVQWWDGGEEKQRRATRASKTGELLTSACLSIFSFSKTSQYSDSSSFFKISFTSSIPPVLEVVLDPCEQTQKGSCFLLTSLLPCILHSLPHPHAAAGVRGQWPPLPVHGARPPQDQPSGLSGDQTK